MSGASLKPLHDCAAWPSASGRLPPTAVWLESGLSTRRFIVAMIVS